MIQVAISFDQNYFIQFFVLAASVFESHSGEDVTWHVIVTGLSSDQVSLIENFIAEKKSRIHFYEIAKAEIDRLVLKDKWTAAVYYRLYFPLVLPGSISRFLYLDVDTVVVNQLNDLWNVDLNGKPIAAVYDNFVKTQPLLGIHHEGEYFNSGVMLIDRLEWNELKVSERCVEFVANNPDKIKFVDQCGLNAVLHGNWLKLDAKYNFLFTYVPPAASLKQLKEISKKLVIIHYTLDRPWHMLCRNRLRYFYFYFLRKSPIAKSAKKIVDFEIGKLPLFIKYKIIELYFDLPGVGQAWRALKKSI